MPTNAKMPELKKAFESAGFTDVKTILSSGMSCSARATRQKRRSSAKPKPR